MTTTTDVKFWEVRRNKSSSKPSYEVRWVVGGRGKSRTRRTKALADSFLSELRQAAKRGESFDLATGLPESMLKATDDTTWYSYVLGYVDKRWPGAAANTRKSMLEALGTVTAALVQDRPYKPDFADRYRVLVRHALAPGSRADQRSPDDAKILRWIESASVP